MITQHQIDAAKIHSLYEEHAIPTEWVLRGSILIKNQFSEE
jgi:hypothetical protein